MPSPASPELPQALPVLPNLSRIYPLPSMTPPPPPWTKPTAPPVWTTTISLTSFLLPSWSLQFVLYTRGRQTFPVKSQTINISGLASPAVSVSIPPSKGKAARASTETNSSGIPVKLYL